LRLFRISTATAPSIRLSLEPLPSGEPRTQPRSRANALFP
jgi:hypothetical protein